MTPALMFLASMALLWLAVDILGSGVSNAPFFAMVLFSLCIVFALDSLIDAGATVYQWFQSEGSLRERVSSWANRDK